MGLMMAEPDPERVILLSQEYWEIKDNRILRLLATGF
jgi:hypothetical protein